MLRLLSPHSKRQKGITMNKIDKYLFETFATMHPIEAYDEYPDEFCAFMREKVGNHMTDADISAFVEEQRKNLPIEVDVSQRVSEIARGVIQGIEACDNCVAYGFWNELHKIYDKAWPHCPDKHPIEKWQRVLNALDRECKRPDAIFEKRYFKAYRGLARMFVLKEANKGNN